MKQISLFILLCVHLSAFADHPLWMKRRNLALNFFRPQSNVSFSIGRELYNRGFEEGFFPRDFVSWQGADATHPFYIFQNECLILNGMPKERCLLFNDNLNLASPLYLGWVFAQGYAQEILFAMAERGLSHLPLHERNLFLKQFPHYVEMEDFIQLYAMMWWHEIGQHWDEISSRITGMKTFLDHDYALQPEHDPFYEVAVMNEGSVNEIHSWFVADLGTDGERFLEKMRERKSRLDPFIKSWGSFHDDERFHYVIQALEEEIVSLRARLREIR